MFRRIAAVSAAISTLALSAGCAVLECSDYVSKQDIMNSWLGEDVIEYERRNGFRPIEVLERPQNRTEYSYQSYYDSIYDELTGRTDTYQCIDRMTVDNATGEIVDWAYEGAGCYGYCRSRG